MPTAAAAIDADSLVTRLEELEQRGHDLADERRQLEEQASLLGRENETLAAESARWATAMFELRQRLGAGGGASGEASSLRVEAERLRAEVERLHAEVALRDREIERVRAQAEQLHHEVDRLHAEVAARDHEIERARARAEELHHEVDRLHAEVRRRDRETEQVRGAVSGSEPGTHTIEASLRDELARARSEAGDLRNANAAMAGTRTWKLRGFVLRLIGRGR